MPLPPLMAGAALTVLTAGLLHIRRQRIEAEAASASTPRDTTAKDVLRIRRRLSILVRSLGEQRLGAWRHELALFTENVASLRDLSVSESRLRLDDSLPPPTPEELATIRRCAAQIDLQDGQAQSRADAATEAERAALERVLTEMGMSQGALRELMEGMEARLLQLDRLIPAVEERLRVIEKRQYALVDPIREVKETLARLHPGKGPEEQQVIAYHTSVREGLTAEVGQLRAELMRLTEELPRLRTEQQMLGERIDTQMGHIGGRFVLERHAGREVPRLILPIDDARDRRRQWQDEQHRHDLAEIALTAIAPDSVLADDTQTDNSTIRWLMAESAPETIEPIVVLGGIRLSVDDHRATLTGEGGTPAVLTTLVRSMGALESVLREWLDTLELLRLRTGIIQRRLQHTLRANSSYRTMVESPLPGALFGPRVFVFRSHQLARAVLLLTDGAILEPDGRLARGISTRMAHAQRAQKLNGWQ